MQIEKKQIAHNRTKRSREIQYIVIHDTGNTKKGANADAHFAYFNGGNRGSSADFFVDDTKILQVNDYSAYYTWHVGDGKGKYGITNQNSIGIEICINEDGDYEKAFFHCAELTKHLMKQLGIPKERVVRHYDASRKKCPASMQNENWANWQEFQNRLSEEDTMQDTTFTDIKNHYAEKEIAELHYMGVLHGVDETHFAPDEPLTRAQAAILARHVIRYITGQ